MTLARLMAQAKRDADYWQEAYFGLQRQFVGDKGQKTTKGEDAHGMPSCHTASG